MLNIVDLILLNTILFNFLLASSLSNRDISRTSHSEFLNNRNWDVIRKFWKSIFHRNQFPKYVSPSEGYGLSDIRIVNDIGLQGEFFSKDPRYLNRKTYAMTIGYQGSEYYGFQQQRGVPNIATVEEDIRKAVKLSITAAGRTDRDVSALSQVISFTSTSIMEPADYLNLINLSPAGSLPQRVLV